MNAREFSIDVVRRLQSAGFTAFWAGGCVRDQLLGREPKDFDVATSATPAEVRQLFGHKRTLAIGAAFGVITVLGPKSAGQIEVATFRRDGGYSDGRRPDAVEFADAREDAIRRDFTINGMFFDPIGKEVIDFVNGQEDVGRKMIRAIGDPEQRIEEDKLRMLRGIRFAATFDFQIESATFEAIADHCGEITAVSAERTGAEIQRMFEHPNRIHAVHLLLNSGLLQQVLPAETQLQFLQDEASRETRMAKLKSPSTLTFESFLVALLEPNFGAGQNAKQAYRYTSALQQAWRLTNDQRKAIGWIAAHYRMLHGATVEPWPKIQRLLINDQASEALEVAGILLGPGAGIEFCRSRLAWPTEKLNPPPLIDGRMLIEQGVSPGPAFKPVLELVRDAQLNGEIATSDEALAMALERLEGSAQGGADGHLG